MKSFAVFIVAMLFVSGCQSETVTTPEAVEVTPVSFNLEGAPTTEMSVPDMMCEFSCAAKVKEVLSEHPGVKDVKIDFEAKKAIIAFDAAKFDGAAAVAELVDYSFSNTKLITSEETEN